jgi:hypothetical protein
MLRGKRPCNLIWMSMYRNKPPALGLQLDRCDVCGDKHHRNDLVRTQVEFLDMKAENYVRSSSYSSTYWAVDSASDVTSTTVGTYGVRCDNVRLSLDNDSNLTYINSPKVWEGNGTVRMVELSSYFTEGSDMTFSVVWGPHEQNTSPSSTIVMGICNSDGSSKQAIRTWSNVAQTTRLWVNEEVRTLATYAQADLSGTNVACRWYFQVTNAGKWWWDEAQLEANVNSLPNETAGVPENFVRTSAGTNVSNQSERGLITSRKVCPKCREIVLKKSEIYGRTDESPIAEPVEEWTQEF